MATRCGVTVTPGCTRCAPFTTITSPGFSPSRTMRNPSITRPKFHLAIFDLIVGAEQQHVFLVLIGVDRTIFDQDRRIFVARQQLHAGEQAGSELSVFVLPARPARGLCRFADSIGCREIEGAGVRKPFLVGEPDLNRVPVASDWALAVTRHLHVAQVALLIARRNTGKSDPSTRPMTARSRRCCRP